jgi:hypothetical protein
MAGDWIKMRGSLCTHPKVLMIAEIIGASTEIGRRLSTGFSGALEEIVTRDVTRDVTLAALLRVWCATNEHTDDGVWHNSTLATLDHAAGISGFGAAMAEAGWAIFDEENRTVTLPNFLENNAPAKNNARTTSAERQARYRDKKRNCDAKSDVTRNVTDGVTSNAREEKRREEKNKPKSQKHSSPPVGDDELFPGVDQQVISDFKALRKQKKAPITKTAMDRIASEAQKSGMSLEGALRMCCSRGWQGFQADWVERRSADRQPGLAQEKFDPVAYVNRNRTAQ